MSSFPNMSGGFNPAALVAKGVKGKLPAKALTGLAGNPAKALAGIAGNPAGALAGIAGNPTAALAGIAGNPTAALSGLAGNPTAALAGLGSSLTEGLSAAGLSDVMGSLAPSSSSAPYAGSVKNGIYSYIADNGATKLIVAIVILSLFVIAYIVIVIVLIYVMVRLMRRSLRLIMKKHYASGFSQGIFGFFGMILVISAVIFSPVSIAASYTEEIGQFVEGLL